MRDYSKGILVAGFSKEALNCASNLVKLVANCVENLREVSAPLRGSNVYLLLITDNYDTIDILEYRSN